MCLTCKPWQLLLILGWVLLLPGLSYGQGKLPRHRPGRPLPDTVYTYRPQGFRWEALDVYEILFTSPDSQDRRYVEAYPRIASIRPVYGRRVTTFGFSPANRYLENRQYYPNVRSAVGLAFFYGMNGFAINYNFDNTDPLRVQTYGRTRYVDLNFNTYDVRFGYDLLYQSYRGFFVARPQNIFYPTQAVSEPYPSRADILLRNAGINLWHVYNWAKFSMPAAFAQVRRQKRSAGSPLHLITAFYTTIRGDSAIQSPAAFGASVGADSGGPAFSRGRYLTLSFAPGYGYTVVVGHFYASAVAFVGPGLQLQQVGLAGRDDYYLSTILRTQLRGAIGFDKNRWFGSAQLLYDRNRNYLEGLRLQITNNGFTLQAGYRF